MPRKTSTGASPFTPSYASNKVQRISSTEEAIENCFPLCISRSPCNIVHHNLIHSRGLLFYSRYRDGNGSLQAKTPKDSRSCLTETLNEYTIQQILNVLIAHVDAVNIVEVVNLVLL